MSERNLSAVKVEMPVQDPQVRAQNFEEVALGYTPEMAREEAARCLQCRHRPCVSGCPVGVRIPDFIARVAEGGLRRGLPVIRENNALPAVCGGSALRRASVRANASGASRASRWPSAGWSALSPTGPESTSPAEEVRPEPNGHRVAVVGARSLWPHLRRGAGQTRLCRHRL